MDLLLMTPRLPLAGETMFSEDYFFNAGGKGANQAVAAARLGCAATFAGKVGNDDFGETLRRGLADYGVCTDFVATFTEKQTGFAVIILEENGQNRIIVHSSANMEITPADIDAAFRQNYDAMIIQFEIAEDIVVYACNLAKQRGVPFFVDAGPPQNFPLEKITGATVLSPNETEAAFMCGFSLENEDDYKKAAKILKQRSQAEHIVLKLGKNGACLYSADNGETKIFPSHEVKAVDTTAAGDVFTAAMTAQFLASGDIAKAIKYANVAGALTVTKAGAQQSIPQIADVAAFISAKNIVI